MNYFSYLPTLDYYNSTTLKTTDLVGKNVVGAQKNVKIDAKLRNLFVGYRIRDLILSSATAYYPYIWQDGDRPDTVADGYYGDPGYWWVVMLSNASMDLNSDFAMPAARLTNYMVSKYFDLYAPTFTPVPTDAYQLSAEQRQAVLDGLQTLPHHYVNADGLIVDSTAVGATMVSVYDWEIAENDDRRKVRLLDRAYLPQIINEYQAEANVRRYRGRATATQSSINTSPPRQLKSNFRQ